MINWEVMILTNIEFTATECNGVGIKHFRSSSITVLLLMMSEFF